MTTSSENPTSDCSSEIEANDDCWHLRIYVVGQAPKSLAALINLKAICEQHLPDQYHIEVVDLLNSPEAAELDQIVAVPTTVKLKPPPSNRVIGDLRDHEKSRMGLGITASPSNIADDECK